MKIYFAGSIRGGRDDKDLYLQIIKVLSQYGSVLTEHIGEAALTSMGEAVTETFIYDRDVTWLLQSDVMVAEVTTASLGVGYEIGKAEGVGKQILCVYREIEGKKLSAMVMGNKNLVVKKYNSISELEQILKDFFSSL
jgi:nucleoside 2-deoxyribosyltransferase